MTPILIEFIEGPEMTEDGEADLAYVPIGDSFGVTGWSEDANDDEAFIGIRIATMSGIVITWPIEEAKTLMGALGHAIRMTEAGQAQKQRERARNAAADAAPTTTTTPSA